MEEYNSKGRKLKNRDDAIRLRKVGRVDDGLKKKDEGGMVRGRGE